MEESPGETELIQKNANLTQIHPFHAHLPREVVKVSTTKVRVAEDDSGYFEQVQLLVAKIVYLLDETDSSSLFGLYRVVRRYLYRGGPRRTCITLPPLIFALLRLAHRRYKEETNSAPLSDNNSESAENSAQHIFEFALETLSSLSESNVVTSLHLYLQGALAVNECAFRNNNDTVSSCAMPRGCNNNNNNNDPSFYTSSLQELIFCMKKKLQTRESNFLLCYLLLGRCVAFIV